MVSVHLMLHMTMLEEAMRVGIELRFHLPWLHSMLLVLMEVMLSMLMVLSLPQLLPLNTGRFGIMDGMFPSMGAA